MLATRDSEIGSLRTAVVEAGARWSSSQRELVHLVAELDRSREYTLDDSPTCAHWVAGAVDVEVSTAREWLRIGHALARLPVTDRAFAHGSLSYSKVRTLTRVATVDNEAELCALAERVTAERLRHAIVVWRSKRETPEQTDARQHEGRAFGWHTDLDGMTVATLRLAPAVAATITTPIDTIISQRRPRPHRERASADASDDCRKRWPSIAQQRADALLELLAAGGATIDTELVIHVRGDGCSLDDGTSITETVVERIAPDAFLRVLIHDAAGNPINASGRQRHPTARQRRVVRARDRACVDCGASEFLEYDHDPDYEVTLHTLVDETFLRCRTCHRARHKRNAQN